MFEIFEISRSRFLRIFWRGQNGPTTGAKCRSRPIFSSRKPDFPGFAPKKPKNPQKNPEKSEKNQKIPKSAQMFGTLCGTCCTCDGCEPGEYANGTGFTACRVCEAGFYVYFFPPIEYADGKHYVKIGADTPRTRCLMSMAPAPSPAPRRQFGHSSPWPQPTNPGAKSAKSDGNDQPRVA